MVLLHYHSSRRSSALPSLHIHAELSTLVELFYGSLGDLGIFQVASAKDVPESYRKLLVHNHHMTVTMEEFYRSQVHVQVLEAKQAANCYSRRILLDRESDGRVVQFGIVRLNFDFLSPEVREEIESQRTPLGRILIKYNVLREIELVGLWRVTPGADLCRLFATTPEQITYARTAIIHCDGQPAVELLEIAAPVGPENSNVAQ
jgi:chorismate-pyruvate lyase